MVDQLATEYAGQNVLFLEDTVEALNGDLYGHWWDSAAASGSVYLPMVMVDSGYQVSSGYENFYTRYKQMVNSALAQPAQVELSAEWYVPFGGDAQVKISVRNTSGAALSAANQAHLHLLAYAEGAPTYEGEQNHVTSRFVVSAADDTLALADQEQATLIKNLPAAAGFSWDALKVVVIADYRPGGSSGAHRSLQAAAATHASQPLSFQVDQTSLTAVIPVNSGAHTYPIQVSAPAGYPWSAAAQPAAAWLQLSPASGTGSTTVQVDILSSAMAPGSYQTSLVFTSPSAQFEPLSVPLAIYATAHPPIYLPLVRQ